jgi:glutathione-independent formaldehyde dehydrogenase
VPSNRGVVYLVPGKVDVRNIDSYLRNPAEKPITHSVILKVVSRNICGSHQHMVRGRIHVSNHGRITIFAGGVPLQRDGS